jgi:hypothetical protein
LFGCVSSKQFQAFQSDSAAAPSVPTTIGASRDVLPTGDAAAVRAMRPAGSTRPYACQRAFLHAA